MPKIPTTLRERLREFMDARASARDATNKFNREKTALKKLVVDTMRELELPTNSIVRSGGVDIRYDVTESTKVEAETLLDMYEAGDLPRNHLLEMLTVTKTAAKRILGDDVVTGLEVKERGSRADLRITDSPIDNVTDESIIAPTELAMTKTAKPKRKVIGRRNDTPSKSTGTVRRRISKK